MLSAATHPTTGANPHVVMVNDGALPRNADGAPVYLPVWDFVIFP